MSACNCSSIDECNSLQRILMMLNKYHQWIYHETDKDKNGMNNVLNKSPSYSTKHIINDYQHIKEKEYNMSMNKILCPHSISNCIPLNRHKRDNYKNYTQQYYTNDVKEIITQKLLDQIHLCLYHPISSNKKRNQQITHRFCTDTKHESLHQNQPNKEPIQEIQIDKTEENKYDHDTIINDENVEEEEENKVAEIQQTINPAQESAYSFGQQFFYWKYYKDHKWFITPKYKNLQEELLQNNMYKMEKIIWDEECQNATDKLQCDDKVKALRSNNVFHDKYDIPENIEISMNHLLSILFYCNTDELQRIFSSTYRIFENINESDDDFKGRHSNYFHFGKLLREVVDVFGMVLVDDELTLYHGINHPLYFDKMRAKFYCPTSTSKNRVIAAEFAGDNGMILEFGKYERNAFYFDCFVSSYARESEYLFIGGYAAIKIKNILHFISKTNTIENYAQHLLFIQCFFSVISNQSIESQILSSIQYKKNNMLSMIISKNSDKKPCNFSYKPTNEAVPKYITNLFYFRCSKISELEINLTEFVKMSKILNIQNQCMNTEKTMININLLSQIFPYLNRVKIILSNEFNFTNSIIKYLYENLAEYVIRSSKTFQLIEFCFYKYLSFDIRDQMISQLHDDFDNIGWAISIEKNDNNDESIFFAKINAEFNPQYQPISNALRAQYTVSVDIIQHKVKQPLIHKDLNNKNSTLQAIQKEKIYRKDSIKDLKLRIIHGPLRSTTGESSVCCLCCKDLVGELS
eukprot:431114_1